MSNPTNKGVTTGQRLVIFQIWNSFSCLLVNLSTLKFRCRLLNQTCILCKINGAIWSMEDQVIMKWPIFYFFGLTTKLSFLMHYPVFILDLSQQCTKLKLKVIVKGIQNRKHFLSNPTNKGLTPSQKFVILKLWWSITLTLINVLNSNVIYPSLLEQGSLLLSILPSLY